MENPLKCYIRRCHSFRAAMIKGSIAIFVTNRLFYCATRQEPATNSCWAMFLSKSKCKNALTSILCKCSNNFDIYIYIYSRVKPLSCFSFKTKKWLGKKSYFRVICKFAFCQIYRPSIYQIVAINLMAACLKANCFYLWSCRAPNNQRSGQL